MNRILVIGPGGAGKSTFARQLGELLALPVIHLDAHHWKPGWTAPDKAEWNARVAELVQGEAWVMDGNFSGSLAARLAACDTVLFLDLPRALCLRRVLKRRLLHRWRGRPDMAPGCPEQLDREFLAWIWNYGKTTRPKVLTLIDQAGKGKTVVRFRRPSEIAAFMDRLKLHA
jgi:adenylate kinase family enzyme